MSSTEAKPLPKFDVMVQRLFKRTPDVPFASLIHACIGMSGEAGELLSADSRENIIEECGDLEFYIEAAKQEFEPLMDETSKVIPHTDVTLGNVLLNLVKLTAEAIDISKKSWVYEKQLDRKSMTTLIIGIEINLRTLYRFMGTSQGEVVYKNQMKLVGPGGRFESGFYSNEQAIARADKAGEGRNFIGQQK